ncbi:MAG: hypothetical protein K2H96_09890 [Muribaculaceae bacterium]|nr:hypothetical protein [Muribaculaceae bacterium]
MREIVNLKSAIHVFFAFGMGLLFCSCDEGKIYPSENNGDGDGFTVVLSGNITGTEGYAGTGYAPVLAVFEEGSDFAEVSKAVETGDSKVEINNVKVEEGSAELCVINTLRKRVLTLASVDISKSSAENGGVVRFEVGDVNVSPFESISSRIFSTTCIQCHGGTSHSAAGLNLSREQAYSMLVNVPSAVEEGMFRVKPEELTKSTLWEAVATDASAHWSFNHSNLLTVEESGFISNWIEKGAEK